MIPTILSMILGVLSAFSIFAMGFNGSPFTYQICLFIVIAIWLPAYLTSKFGNKKPPAEPTR